MWITVTKNKLYWCHGYLLVQNADCRLQNAECRLDTKCRPVTKCRLQTGYKMQTENLKCFFSMVCDNMSSYNLPSITQSLFRDQLSWLFALLCNIPGLFLDQNHSWYNSKPSYSLLTLHLSWFLWCLYKCYQLNKSRCRCKWGVTIEYLTRTTLENQLTALHVVHHLFMWYVLILLTEMWTETKIVPSTWYIFNVRRSHQISVTSVNHSF